MTPTLEFVGLDNLLSQLDKIPTLVQSGVKVDSAAAGYFYIWETGRITCQPGPKTMWSTSPVTGGQVVLTIQAPNGYIRLNQPEYIRIINEEFQAVPWSIIPLDRVEEVLNALMDRAADRCDILIGSIAPVDTGNLIFSIHPAHHDDPVVQDGGESTYGSEPFDVSV